MMEIIKKLQEDLKGLETNARNYRKWIKEAKEEKNEYVVECYSEDLKHIEELTPQYKKAIRVLKSAK